MKKDKDTKAIILFMTITVVFSAVMETLIIVMGAMGLAAFLMWIPAFAAFVTKLVYYKGEKYVMGFRKCRPVYILYAIIIPFAYISIPYIIYWIVNPELSKFEVSLRVFIPLLICIPVAMITAIGEEIGWRGFLVPKLFEKLGLMRTLLLSSLIWCLWHMPILISGLYMPGTPVWYKILLFTLNIGAVGFMVGILSIESKSVWPAAIFHAAHNGFDQMIFGPLTLGDNKMYWVSETGVLTTVLAIIFAVIMLISFKKKHENNL